MSHFHKRAGILGRQARRWARVRRLVLDSASWRCASCGRYANEVDHTRPLERGGEAWAMGNLQVLCRTCHIRKTRRENRRPPSPAEMRWAALVGEVAGR